MPCLVQDHDGGLNVIHGAHVDFFYDSAAWQNSITFYHGVRVPARKQSAAPVADVDHVPELFVILRHAVGCQDCWVSAVNHHAFLNCVQEERHRQVFVCDFQEDCKRASFFTAVYLAQQVLQVFLVQRQFSDERGSFIDFLAICVYTKPSLDPTSIIMFCFTLFLLLSEAPKNASNITFQLTASFSSTFCTFSSSFARSASTMAQ